MDDKKRKISLQYQLTNVFLFNEVFGNWKEFNEILKAGPDAVIQFLFNKWNELKEYFVKREDLEVQDSEREITIEEFNVVYTPIDNIPIFFFIFPDIVYKDAASKYVALALTEKAPRYITLECSENRLTNETHWAYGEFKFEDNHLVHLNYGKALDISLNAFQDFVIYIVKNPDAKDLKTFKTTLN